MKKVYLLNLFLFLSTAIFAQKVKVENALESIGNGYNMAYRVSIPHAEEKAVTKKWTSFLKDNRAKVKSSKGSINGTNMVINGIGSDSIQVYSRVSENDGGCMLTAAFERNGTFITPTTNATDSDLITKLLMDMAMALSKEGIENKTEDAIKVLNAKTKEQENLTKTNSRLSSDNDKMKKEISDNEKDIDNNTRRLEDLKKEISTQQQTIEAIKAKVSEL